MTACQCQEPSHAAMRLEAARPDFHPERHPGVPEASTRFDHFTFEALRVAPDQPDFARWKSLLLQQSFQGNRRHGEDLAVGQCMMKSLYAGRTTHLGILRLARADDLGFADPSRDGDP